MIKIVLAVIKDEDRVLLIQRAKGNKYAGMLELPGGKVENGERTSVSLRRNLDAKLGINFDIGKLITSVTFGQKEIYAYNIDDTNCGLIKSESFGNSDLKWISLNSVLQYNLAPETRQIIMHMTKTKETVKVASPVQSFVLNKIKKPVFNEETKRWEITINKKLHSFEEQEKAMDLYINAAREMLKPLFAAPQNIH